jgi:hypothetical protein
MYRMGYSRCDGCDTYTKGQDHVVKKVESWWKSGGYKAKGLTTAEIMYVPSPIVYHSLRSPPQLEVVEICLRQLYWLPTDVFIFTVSRESMRHAIL